MSSSTERVNLGLPSGRQALPAGEQCGEMWGATVKCGCRYSPPTEGRKDLRVSRRFCGAGTGGDYRSGQCRLNLDWISRPGFLPSASQKPKSSWETHSPILNASAFLQIQHHAREAPLPAPSFLFYSLLFFLLLSFVGISRSCPS
jgi:hypothetical protein